jgi:hypothetical protein
MQCQPQFRSIANEFASYATASRVHPLSPALLASGPRAPTLCSVVYCVDNFFFRRKLLFFVCCPRLCLTLDSWRKSVADFEKTCSSSVCCSKCICDNCFCKHGGGILLRYCLRCLIFSPPCSFSPPIQRIHRIVMPTSTCASSRSEKNDLLVQLKQGLL